jgi:hypothetical protein
MLAVNEHNTWIGAANFGWGAFSGHPNGVNAIYPSNQWLQSFRSNLMYATTGAMNFGIGDAAPSTAWNQSPANEWNLAGITNNAYFGASSASQFGPGVNANCNPGGLGSTSLGTHYNICTATGTPGANDISSIDPYFIDKTRNAAQWAVRLHGQPYPTYAAVLAAMMQCPDAGYCVNELTTWVKTGMMPTNMALKGKAHDGTDIGAVQMTSFGSVE